MLQIRQGPDDTVQTYTHRIEEGLRLPDVSERLRQRGKLP
jgi:hypothetical protein